MTRAKSVWNRVVGPMQKKFRTRRAHEIVRQFPEVQGASILDLGGSLPFWDLMGPIIRPGRVRIYNIHASATTMRDDRPGSNLETRLYDGLRLPEDDQSFDFVFCNSVIEHVPVEQHANLAREIHRVGRRHVVQTPAIGFPVDVHFGLPFMHWLPRPVGRRLALISPFALFSDGNAASYFEQTQLLTRRAFRTLFPDSTVTIERFWGLPKSMTAFGPHPAARTTT